MKQLFLILTFTVIYYSLHAQITVDNNNMIGIRTTSPVNELDVNSPYSRLFYSNTNKDIVFNLYNYDPRIQTNTGIVFYKIDNSGFIDIQCRTLYQYSDSTAKEGIASLGSNPVKSDKPSHQNIDKIKLLRGVNYTWKDDKEKKQHAGFLAQEVEKIIPEAVITNDSTQIKSMSYEAIIPYLVEALKEQQVQIEELQSLLEASKIK